jgi:molybdenum cofactor cytidylyltransferase
MSTFNQPLGGNDMARFGGPATMMRLPTQVGAKGLDVAFVHNADFAAGLASSLATGVRAVPGDVGGVMVLLGDMPLVTARQMDRLIAAFNPLEGRRIVVPSHDGRRGNPVLWGRDFFGELEALRGDQGGKPLLEAHAEWVVEIDAGSDTVHRDFDVPGDLEP